MQKNMHMYLFYEKKKEKRRNKELHVSVFKTRIESCFRDRPTRSKVFHLEVLLGLEVLD